MTATKTAAKAEKFGLSVALATPFTAHQGIDFERMVNHAEWCLGHGCDSVTLFGTTGEGASIGIAGAPADARRAWQAPASTPRAGRRRRGGRVRA